MTGQAEAVPGRIVTRHAHPVMLRSAKPNRSIHGSVIWSSGFCDGACTTYCDFAQHRLRRSARFARFAQNDGKRVGVTSNDEYPNDSKATGAMLTQ
jgi:hypothetical protein